MIFCISRIDVIKKPHHLMRLFFCLGFIYAEYFLNTRLALVPPKPKLLDMIRFKSALSLRVVTTGMLPAAGSSSSTFADAVMKLFSIISKQ